MVTDFSAAEKARGVNFACVLAYYPDRSSLLLEVKGQGHQGQKTRLVLRSPTQLAYEWYALAACARRTSAFPAG